MKRIIEKMVSIPLGKRILIVDILSVFVAYFFVNYLDILTTDYKWIQWMKEHGLFHIYDSWNIEVPIDYPPLYLIWLYLIRNIVGTMLSNYTQLIMKSLPLAVQFISQAFIYKKISPEAAWKWTINFALLINIVVYGQRDGIIGLLVILLYYCFKNKKWLEPAIVVTILCLLKPQGIYFIFILVIYYISIKLPLKKILLAVITNSAIAFLVFLPFAVTSNDYLVSLKLYLYEFSIHKVFGSVAGNVWGLFEYWRLPYIIEKASVLLIIGCMVLAVIIYVRTKDFLHTSIVYMMSIFMFTISQHGRYSIYTMFLLYIAVYMYSDKKYVNSYRAITISTAIAQIGMIAYNKIIVYVYGLDVINTTIEMTYGMLKMLYTIRYITIISTFIINVYSIVMIFKTEQVNNGRTEDCYNEQIDSGC